MRLTYSNWTDSTNGWLHGPVSVALLNLDCLSDSWGIKKKQMPALHPTLSDKSIVWAWDVCVGGEGHQVSFMCHMVLKTKSEKGKLEGVFGLIQQVWSPN